MSMFVQLKIGTMPGNVGFIKHVRRCPRVGQRIEFKEYVTPWLKTKSGRPLPSPGQRWTTGIVWKVEGERVFINLC